MKHGYFEQIKDNYRVLLGINKAIILFFDGKDVTANPLIDLYDFNKGSFSKSLLLTAREFSSRWKCKALVGVDEMVFIIENPEHFIKKYRNMVDDMVCVIGQEIFLYFNNTYKGRDKIFFHEKIFAIPFDKVDSFIKYQSNRHLNVLTVYWMKKYGYFNTGISLSEMLETAQKHEEYNDLIPLFKDGLIIENRKCYISSKYIDGKKEEYILPKDNSFNKFKKVDVDDF